MLNNQTIALMRAMKLPAMANEYQRQLETPAMTALDFEERIGMIVDAEWLQRENSRIQRLKKAANLRFNDACFANIDYRQSRKLERSSIARLSGFAWIKEHLNIIITGATGTGKTWLACAFGEEACRMGVKTAFYRASRLINELCAAAANDVLDKLLAKLKKCELLIIDDWGLTTIAPTESRLLLEVFEDRYNACSSIISAQIPVAKWHSLFEDSTIADAILDRIVHNSYRFELRGSSLRFNKDFGGGTPYGVQGQNIDAQSDDDTISKDGENDAIQ